jgi:hypothetical protein
MQPSKTWKSELSYSRIWCPFLSPGSFLIHTFAANVNAVNRVRDSGSSPGPGKNFIFLKIIEYEQLKIVTSQAFLNLLDENILYVSNATSKLNNTTYLFKLRSLRIIGQLMFYFPTILHTQSNGQKENATTNELTLTNNRRIDSHCNCIRYSYIRNCPSLVDIWFKT